MWAAAAAYRGLLRPGARPPRPAAHPGPRSRQVRVLDDELDVLVRQLGDAHRGLVGVRHGRPPQTPTHLPPPGSSRPAARPPSAPWRPGGPARPCPAPLRSGPSRPAPRPRPPVPAPFAPKKSPCQAGGASLLVPGKGRARPVLAPAPSVPSSPALVQPRQVLDLWGGGRRALRGKGGGRATLPQAPRPSPSPGGRFAAAGEAERMERGAGRKASRWSGAGE